MKAYKKALNIQNVNKAPVKPTFKCPCGFITHDQRKIMQHEKACRKENK